MTLNESNSLPLPKLRRLSSIVTGPNAHGPAFTMPLDRTAELDAPPPDRPFYGIDAPLRYLTPGAGRADK